jgi:hypothetical protein
MAVILKADNRTLLEDASYSYLSTNYASGVATLVVTNSSDFAVNQYVLVGTFGSSTAEILKIASVSSGSLTFKDESAVAASTVYAHPESTRVTVLPYNQVKFYHTTTTTYGTSTQVGSTTNIRAQDWYTTVTDSTYSTGYGWYVWYNQGAATTSTNSAYIPYAGYSGNTVKKVFDRFYSILNNNELKLISSTDSYAWLNEAYAIVRNELNLVNQEYFASDIQTLSVVSGTAEYSLPSDFSDLLTLYVSGASPQQIVLPIPLSEIPSYAGTTPRYYLRGSVLGITPTPDAAATWYYRYVSRATELTANTDSIDLPDNAFYAVTDFMWGRAYQKLTSPNSSVYFGKFKEWSDRMKTTSIKRDSGLDSWSISPYANV